MTPEPSSESFLHVLDGPMDVSNVSTIKAAISPEPGDDQSISAVVAFSED